MISVNGKANGWLGWRVPGLEWYELNFRCYVERDTTRGDQEAQAREVLIQRMFFETPSSFESPWKVA